MEWKNVLPSSDQPVTSITIDGRLYTAYLQVKSNRTYVYVFLQ